MAHDFRRKMAEVQNEQHGMVQAGKIWNDDSLGPIVPSRGGMEGREGSQLRGVDSVVFQDQE